MLPRAEQLSRGVYGKHAKICGGIFARYLRDNRRRGNYAILKEVAVRLLLRDRLRKRERGRAVGRVYRIAFFFRSARRPAEQT